MDSDPSRLPEISILIPVYNRDVCDLLKSLNEQAVRLSCGYEILCLDDASYEEFVLLNENFTVDIPEVIFDRNLNNEGRARTRNRLAEEARGKWLLFMDCDVQLDDELFLQKYLDARKDGAVVCGGVGYHAYPPEHRELLLHWTYGRDREQLSASERNLHPYRGFKTFHFLIERELFQKIRFDDSLTSYGHEDTLFGFQLEQREIPIIHIDNPAIHDGLEAGRNFLKKQTKALLNLQVITDKHPEIAHTIRVLRVYHKLKDIRLVWLFRLIFSATKGIAQKQLLSRRPRIRWLDLYKLGVLASRK